MKINNRGFTLVEVIVTVGILGVITLIAFPAILELQSSNLNTKYKAYMDSLGSNARVYIDNYKKDIFPDEEVDSCFVIDYETLLYNDLIKPIDEEGITCGVDDTFVRVNLEDGRYSYDTSLKCEDTVGKVVFEEPDDPIDINSCDILDFEGPIIKIVSDDPSSWKKNHTYYIEISDKSSLSDNVIIEYGWSNDGDVPDTFIQYNFNNPFGVESLKTEVTSTNEQSLITDKNNEWTLYVRAVSLLDTNNNDSTGNLVYEVFKLDNNKPLVPVLSSVEDYFDNSLLGDWARESFSLQLESEDLESGIKKWRYSYDLIDWVDYDNSNKNIFETTPFSNDRNQFVYISACDYVELCSDNFSTTIMIDKTKPTVPTSKVRYNNSEGDIRENSDDSYSSSNLWWGEFESSDENGILRYEFSFDCSGNVDGVLEEEYFYDYAVDNKYCIRAVDNSGLESAWSDPTYIRINNSPAIPIVSNPTNGNWVNYDVVLTIVAGDEVPVSFYQYSYDNVNWSNYNDSAGQSYKTDAIVDEQDRLIYIRACSGPSSCSDSASTYLKIDKTPPKVWFTIGEGDHYPNDPHNPAGSRMSFHIGNDDVPSANGVMSGSGKMVVHTYYPHGTVVEGSPHTSGYPISLPTNDAWTYTVHVMGYDQAGNKQVHENTNEHGWYFKNFTITTGAWLPNNSCTIRGTVPRNQNSSGVVISAWNCNHGHRIGTFYQIYCTDANGKIYQLANADWACTVSPYVNGSVYSGNIWYVYDDSSYPWHYAG